MRKATCLIVAMAALVAVPQAFAATINVAITRTAFVPSTVNVNVGDTVVWTNNDTNNHQVASQQSGFASPVLRPAETFAYTFTRAGRFAYEDTLQRQPRLRGTVNVAGPPAGVTIKATPLTVTYGRATTLTGTISSGETGQKVTVSAQACGGTFVKVADVTTTAGGAWGLVVKPTNNTTYRVQWRNVTATLVVKVRPAATLRKLTGGRFAIRVLASASLSGRVATFQRYNATTRRWVRVKLVTLRRLGTAASPFPATVISGGTFRAAVRVGTRVRFVLPQAQVTACHAPVTSNTVIR